MTDDPSVSRRVLELERPLVCDGAMGTMLHSAGIPLGRSISELNIERPRLVHDLHAAYVAAGADILQTNTFDANRVRLANAGLTDRVAEINIAGARLAREAAVGSGRKVLIAGSVGPARSAAMAARVPRAERAAILREQVAALADWVDLIMLETFGEISSLIQAIEVALSECALPIIAQLTFGDDGRTLRGEEPAEVAASLAGYDLAAFGANCTVGPAVLQDVVTELAATADIPIIVQPNAGTPRRLGRGLRYAHNTTYFAAAAVELVGRGARIVGGCCGTTPGHIRAVSDAVANMPVPPPRPRTHTRSPSVPPAVHPGWDDLPVAWPETGRPVVIAGLRPPRGSDVPGYVEAARALASAGADMLAVLDPEPSTARVNPVAAAVLLSERAAADVVLQVEADGRSLAALQADLLGAHAFGLRFVVCRTGGLRVAGDYPDPGSSSDVDSLQLIGTLAGLNDGADWRGVPVPERTRFVIGASVSVSAVDRMWELDRVVEKVRAGAHFLFTDVVYDAAQVRSMLSDIRDRDVTVPLIVAIAPFRDIRTIARLTHEFPEVLIPDSALAAHAAGHDVVAETADMAEKLLLGGDIGGILVFGPGQADTADARLLRIVEKLSRQCRTT